MRKAIYGIEIINAILGVMANIQSINIFKLPIPAWNIGALFVFVIGFIVLFMSDKQLEDNIYKKVIERVTENINQRQGTAESITPKDMALLRLMTIKMARQHGHIDFEGLVADRASGVALNELITRNCSVCGKPRNQNTE